MGILGGGCVSYERGTPVQGYCTSLIRKENPCLGPCGDPRGVGRGAFPMSEVPLYMGYSKLPARYPSTPRYDRAHVAV